LFVCIIDINRFEEDIEFMLGKKPFVYWRIMWMYVTPTLTFVIIIASFYGLGTNGITYLRWDPTIVSAASLSRYHTISRFLYTICVRFLMFFQKRNQPLRSTFRQIVKIC